MMLKMQLYTKVGDSLIYIFIIFVQNKSNI